MFFEPPPAQEESARPPKPGLPGWYAPPAEEMGTVVTSGLVLARTPNIVITLPTIQAFGTGCLMNVDIAMRRHAMSPDDFQALQLSVYPHMVTGVGAGRLPDNLLRFGVRFADGTKATTVGQRFDLARLPQDPPPAPRLSWLLGGASLRSGDDDAGVAAMGLWLWPPPPRETFELGVEWPAGGVELSLTVLDGAAIVSAAERSVPYWPDSAQGE
ncbi:hypothetical protein GCM10022252_12020 [Streptosporangium oxazolinicum]|uniref:Uncharacterized protein n=1 Tax=Streptosporangium oxazolinicum TaxID=909287 RepID=A0ABP8AH79_9ACTN